MKTVKVRIAVAVNSLGNWSAYGYSRGSDKEARSFALEGLLDDAEETVVFVEAEVPLPCCQTIQAEKVHVQ